MRILIQFYIKESTGIYYIIIIHSVYVEIEKKRLSQ